MFKLVLIAITGFTGPSLKVRIEGDGYLRFMRDGLAVYAKEATLGVKDGKLADSAGDGVLPTIAVSAGASALEIDPQGNVYLISAGTKTKAGQLVLASFPPNETLRPQDVVLVATGRPHLGLPGEKDFGLVHTSTDSPRTSAATFVQDPKSQVRDPQRTAEVTGPSSPHGPATGNEVTKSLGESEGFKARTPSLESHESDDTVKVSKTSKPNHEVAGNSQDAKPKAQGSAD